MIRHYERIVTLVLLLLTGCATAPALKVGEPAPPFTALDVSDNQVDLKAFKGKKNVVLMFYIAHT